MGCNSCNKNVCVCGTVPLPYYEDPCFQQNQCQGVQVVAQYTPVIRVVSSWAVPLPDTIVTLKVAALTDMLIGASIWNPDYGSYDVVSYDPDNQLIKVVKSVDNDEVVGTTIESCTRFIIAKPFSSGTLLPCIHEVTTEELNTLVANNDLQIGCTYVITDHTQGRVSQNGAARIYLTALSDDQLTTACSVITTYDTEAWRGVYDLASNTLVELEDNQGNVCRQYQDQYTSLTPVDNFDWGNPSYISCLVDNATWTVDYGLVGDIYRVKVTDRAVFNLTGWTGDYLYNVEISGFADVNFSNGDMEAEEFYATNGAGVECFNTNPDNFLYYTTVDSSFITASASTSSLYMEGCSLQGYSGVYHRVAGDLNLFAVNLSAFGEFRIGGDGPSGVGSVTNVYAENAELTGSKNGVSMRGSSVNIIGTNIAVIDLTRIEVTSGASIKIDTATSDISVQDTSVEAFGLLNLTTAGTIAKTKVSQGELANAGFNLSSVYLNGNVTKTCTANNTDKGKDYFNDNIV